MREFIYLDYSASTPVDPAVVKAMEPYWSEQYGNASSIHEMGRTARIAVEDSRKKVACILHCDPLEIVFTAGGTESVNLAITGIVRANQRKGKHIVTTVIEHHTALHAINYLEKEGWTVTYVPVDKNGHVDPMAVVDIVRDDTVLVSVMYANNEIGTVQPITEISRLVKEKYPQVYFHTDACQAPGSLPLGVNDLGVDLMSLSGSKIYGPKGSAVLYVKNGVKIDPIIHGGGQERNLRSGTESVSLIVGFAKALELIEENREQETKRLMALRERLVTRVLAVVPGAVLNGQGDVLPNKANFSIPGINGNELVLTLDRYGIGCSTASACSSGNPQPSHVVLALGVPYELAQGTVRFSLGKDTTDDDIAYLLEVLPKAVKEVRNKKA
ncbi:MAG: cysteine desulfurase family protein [bacterium]